MRGVGIIGTGRHGSRYANHIVNDIGDMELAAIARRSPEGKDQAAFWQAKWYDDWQALIVDPNVEAVVAAVPPYLNLAIAKECAAAGKPLLIEKPLATKGHDAAEIVSLMQAAGLPLTVGQTLRYNPVIKSLKARIKDMGPLYSFTANQRLEPSTLAWHDVGEIAGAGVVIHTAVHVFDALHFITGRKIRRVKAGRYLRHSKNLEDLVVVLAEMENGVSGTVDISKVGSARSGRYEFICDSGHLYGEQIHSFIDIVRGSVLERVEEPQQINTILPLLKDWNDFLDGKRKNPITGEDGLYAVNVCDACLKSASVGDWVAV
jgi:predicted dehydrogenase